MTLLLLALAQAGVGDEVPPLGEAATMADGPGVVLSVGAGTPDLLSDLPTVPVVPRVGLGAFLEPSDAVLVGMRGGVMARIGDEILPGGEAVAAVALGSRHRTVWTGGEVGVGIVPVVDPATGASASTDVGLLTAGTFGVDLDRTSTLGARVGMVVLPNRVELRHGLTATYRPALRTGVAVGVHHGLSDANGHSLATQLTVQQRIGPLRDAWTEPVVVEEGPKVDVDVQEHPELACEGDDLPTGRPPPLGLEGWCVRVARNGVVVRSGPYVRWHDMVIVAERGQFTDDRRSGEWTRFDHEGNLRERGSFVAGKEEGNWSSYHDDGSVREEGNMVAGEPDGRWRFYDVEGRLDVEGRYAQGRRVGVWFDYDDEGTQVRRREYDAGRLVVDEQLIVVDEDPEPTPPEQESPAEEP